MTKTAVDALPIPARGQAMYRDVLLRGFGVRVTAGGVRSYIIERRIKGRVRRITVCRVGDLAIKQARTEAIKILGKIASGIDPIAEAERARILGITLAQCFDDFRRDRHQLTAKTVYDYERFILSAFPDWRDKPLASITRQMIADRHTKLGHRGEYYANGAMRFLSSLFNFARARYDDGTGETLIPDNPVRRLSDTRSWYRTERRQTIIKPHELPAWYRAVRALRHDGIGQSATVADLLLVLLWTGLRRQEAMKLRWEQVCLPDRSVFLPDTKNHQPLTLPLPAFLVDLLRRRHDEAVSPFVFPGDGRNGYLVEPKKQIARVIAHSGVQFSCHDLRRTFITIAEALDVSPYAIKRLVNHKMRNDVTAGYIVTDLQRLRGPMERISEYLVRATGADESENVITFPIKESNS